MDPILIIEDDRPTFEVIEANLQGFGYPIEHCSHGTVALQKALENNYRLIVLDVNLPGIDGFEICRTLRKEKPLLGILMLTSRTDEIDKVLGLELGADDYLAKPFSVRELRARTKALLRRSEAVEEILQRKTEEEIITAGELRINQAQRLVLLREQEIELTALEFDLLAFLAANPGKPFTREQLIRHVWHYETDSYDRTVTVLANRLRSKIEDDPQNPKYILTERGVGYRFARS